MQTIGVRARESARIAIEMLDEDGDEPDTAATTGSIAAAD